MIKIQQKKHYQGIGLMSGTSMDGIDVALLTSDGEYEIHHHGGAMYPYDKAMHQWLKAAEYIVKLAGGDMHKAQTQFAPLFDEYCMSQLNLDPDELFAYQQSQKNYLVELFINHDACDNQHEPIALHHITLASTLLHIAAVQSFCQQQCITLETINLIGYHGQTLYHNPAEKKTIQIADAELMSARLNKPVIYNFRENDVLLGGHGAPFAPIYHHALAVRDRLALPLAVVNCGGIANISLITDNNRNNIIGFDTGPGNVLLDRIVKQKTDNAECMDKDGHYGLAGTVNETVLNALLQHSCHQHHANYYQLKLPKSLDVNNFNWPIEQLERLSIEDACASLAALTAKTIVEAMSLTEVNQVHTWVLAGGGWHNKAIFHYFNQYAKLHYPQSKIFNSDELGWDGDLLEAELFSYLAIRCIKGLPGTYPRMTGITKPCIAGKIVMLR